MSQPNAGYLFYKKYYGNRPGEYNTSVNEKIERVRLPKGGMSHSELRWPERQHLELTTTYPGLLIGTGYNHDTKDDEKGENEEKSAYKLGFFFDHTTGLPVLPGSGIKGSLRSLFPNAYRKDRFSNVGKSWREYAAPRYAFLKDLLGKICNLAPESITEAQIDALEYEIFAGLRGEMPNKMKAVPLYQRDLFLDAFPVEIAESNLGHEKRVFGHDFITPHINREHPEKSRFTEPNPLKFLKVMPGVKYEFSFVLHQSKVLPLDADGKMRLFKQLLLSKGVGAKTNVGYGRFAGETILKPEVIGPPSRSAQADRTASTPSEVRRPSKAAVYTGRIRNGEGHIEATVLDPEKKLVRIETEKHGAFEVPMTGNCPHEKGDVIIVAINRADRKKNKIIEVGYRGPARR